MKAYVVIREDLAAPLYLRTSLPLPTWTPELERARIFASRAHARVWAPPLARIVPVTTKEREGV